MVDGLPDIVICDTPVAIRSARKRWGRKVKVVYDITEWYPSKKNLRNAPWLLRPLKFGVLLLANVWAGIDADAFLFGEYHKALPFRICMGWKQSMLLPYYPDLSYIPYSLPVAPKQDVRLLYAGQQTAEKGYYRAKQLVEICQDLMPDKRVTLTTINGLSFNAFCEEISHHDICIDLRDADAENTRCLPIKLFYYLAAGKPVIYSNLKAIRHAVPQIAADSLVEPEQIEQAAEMIKRLVEENGRYETIAQRNHQLAEARYNWGRMKDAFVQWIEQI